MSALDRRLAAFRPDLADAALKGTVEAVRFVEGEPARVRAPVADLRSSPSADAGLDTQLLHGRTVRVFERTGGWAWLQSDLDGYVGYCRDDALGPMGATPTHVVAVPRSFVYGEPDMKRPIRACHSIGALVAVDGDAEARGTQYTLLAGGGAMIAAHLLPVGVRVDDPVTVAESLLNTPYLWGGASGFGLDCSGLVQISMLMAGRQVLRDTDMQAASAGEPLDVGPDPAGLKRGDLVFWKGHVGMMLDASRLIHANGHTMLVSQEPLRTAVDRIAYLYGRPTAFRRP